MSTCESWRRRTAIWPTKSGKDDSAAISSYRLNVFPITLPSLRDCRSDIPLLVRHLVSRLAPALRKRVDAIPTEVMRMLETYDWPGNVRELENVLQRVIDPVL